MKPIIRADEWIKNLERYCDLRVTFELPSETKVPFEPENKKLITTRCYVIDVDEDMWSQFVKGFNIHNWHAKGAKMMGQVFESCQGSKRHIAYVNTPLMSLRLITHDYIPIGAKMVEVEYI